MGGVTTLCFFAVGIAVIMCLNHAGAVIFSAGSAGFAFVTSW